MRIRDHSGPLPKPMVTIGYRPILWHVMKYYAHHGHRDFILCLGHGADTIKRYFVDYDETVSNDFVLTSGREVKLLQSDIHDWRITFVDTGLDASVGERLLAVRPFLDEEEWFLANYADGVTDAPLNEMIEFAQASGRAATFLAVKPNYTSHLIDAGPDGRVTRVSFIQDVGLRINGGFFVMNRRYFDFAYPGEDILGAPAQRMAAAGELGAYAYDGFWGCMDTFKEKRMLEDIHKRGDAPWELWQNRRTDGDGSLLRVEVAKSMLNTPPPDLDV
jgi:glucose-1-phosphate cytidylyltransferase